MPQIYEQSLLILLSFIIILAYQTRYWSALIYTRRKSYYFAACCFGVAAVGLALEIEFIILQLNLSSNNFQKAFLHSALIEEFVKILFILFFIYYFKVNEFLYDGIFYGVVIGATFGFIESFFYLHKLDFWQMLLRSITSGIIHLLNGGIAGFYMIQFIMIRKKYRYYYLIKGFVICYLIHGIFNFSGFKGNEFLMLMPVMLILGYIILEFIISFSGSCLPKSTLDLIQLNLVEHEFIKKFIKYELWFFNQQKSRKKYIEIFREVDNKKKIFISIFYFFSIASILLFVFKKNLIEDTFNNIQIYEYLSIFALYPFAISISLLFKGLINPNFFERKVLRVPFICLINIKSENYKEDSILFYINSIGFYVSLENPKNFSENVDMNFIVANRKFNNIKGKLIWSNENRKKIDLINNTRFPTTGALIEFDKIPFSLILFWNIKRISHSFKNLYLSIREL